VLELSSYQIDLTHHLACDIAVFTNLTPDHLDRHGGMAGYAAAKERLFAMLQPGAVAVIATDDPFTRGAARRLPEGVRLIAVSARDIAPSAQQRWPALAGPHNAQNVACAVAAARALGADAEAIEAGLRSFPGLPHRMRTVAIRNGVRFVNDSKATNPASAAPALQAYPSVHWILGGVAKGADLDACLPHLSHVKAAYLIGEAEDLFALLLAPYLPIHHCGTLARAVAEAAVAAVPGDTVLLSPACASFDQFTDFEARGRAFEAAVQALEPNGDSIR
jgi:UDP-N-acetylmuramoylalanine--D-glutamate ligase